MTTGALAEFESPEDAALDLELPLLGMVRSPADEAGPIAPAFPADERTRREYHRAADRILLSPLSSRGSVGLIGDVSSLRRARVSSDLSTLLAAEKTSILVDADLDGAHLSFDERGRAQEGLVDVLRYGVRSPRVVAPTQAPGLNLLPVGSGTVDFASTYGADSAASLFAELRRTGDLVVVNGPDLDHLEVARPFLAEVGGWVLVHDFGSSTAARTRELKATFGADACVGVLAIVADRPPVEIQESPAAELAPPSIAMEPDAGVVEDEAAFQEITEELPSYQDTFEEAVSPGPARESFEEPPAEESRDEEIAAEDETRRFPLEEDAAVEESSPGGPFEPIQAVPPAPTEPAELPETFEPLGQPEPREEIEPRAELEPGEDTVEEPRPRGEDLVTRDTLLEGNGSVLQDEGEEFEEAEEAEGGRRGPSRILAAVLVLAALSVAALFWFGGGDEIPPPTPPPVAQPPGEVTAGPPASEQTPPAPAEPVAETPVAETPMVERPAVERPATPPPAAEKPTAQAPSPTPTAEAPRPEQPATVVAAVRGGEWGVHVTSLRSEAGARQEVELLRQAGYAAVIREVDVPTKGRWHRIYVGPTATKEAAAEVAQEIKKSGFRKYAQPTKIPN